MDENSVIIINGKVIFAPESNSLYPVNDTSKPVVLHTPSSQCLRLLLQNNNQVVSQKILFEEIWEKNGALVTPNTLYQNIALIRKALKAAGLDEEVIKTIPKQGIKISAQITTNNPKEVAETSEYRNHPDSHSSTYGQGTPSLVASTPENRNDAQPSITLSLLQKLSNHQFFLNILPLLLCVFLLYWLYTLSGYLGYSNTFFKDYMDIGKINNCQVYSSYHGTDISKAKFETMVKLSGMKCQPGEKAWLTFNHQYHMSMLIKCDKAITDKRAVCQNFMYEEGVNNE